MSALGVLSVTIRKMCLHLQTWSVSSIYDVFSPWHILLVKVIIAQQSIKNSYLRVNALFIITSTAYVTPLELILTTQVSVNVYSLSQVWLAWLGAIRGSS